MSTRPVEVVGTVVIRQIATKASERGVVACVHYGAPSWLDVDWRDGTTTYVCATTLMRYADWRAAQQSKENAK